MLCPKCGYISFDSLDSCPSCNQDLAETRKTLNGTAIMVEEQYFLGSIYGQDDDTVQHSTPPDEYDNQSEEESMPESNESTSLDKTADDQDEISFDLGEMPPLDQSSLDLSPDLDSDDEQGAEGTAALMDDIPGSEAEISPEPEAGISLTESADLIEEELPPESVSKEEADVAPIILESPLSETKDKKEDDDQLTIDIDSLSLEIDDSPLEEPAGPATEADDSETLSLDLEQIDLSDLVHDPQPAASARENSTIPQVEESLDTGDVNIDEQELTLENLEPEEEALELEFDQDSKGVNASLEPIDLSIDVDAQPEELDLSLDEILTAEEKQ